MTSLFPLIKRFQDVRKSPNTVMITEEVTFYDKSFRKGTVFNVIGWREIDNTSYLVISRGSWEGLINHDSIKDKLYNFVEIK